MSFWVRQILYMYNNNIYIYIYIYIFVIYTHRYMYIYIYIYNIFPVLYINLVNILKSLITSNKNQRSNQCKIIVAKEIDKSLNPHK